LVFISDILCPVRELYYSHTIKITYQGDEIKAKSSFKTLQDTQGQKMKPKRD